MEDVTDYNGVEGDTGLLVKMTPVAKDDTFTNGYVYMKLPLNVTNASVTLKVLGPTDGSDAPQAHFNKKVQWWSVGFHQKANTDLFSESAKGVTYMMWGMKTKLMENGYWQDESHLSCNTDWGAFPTIGEHTYAVKANAENPDNFDFQADAIFPAQCDPYAGTQNDPSATLKPYQMHVSDFENNEAYLHIGMAQPPSRAKTSKSSSFSSRRSTCRKCIPNPYRSETAALRKCRKNRAKNLFCRIRSNLRRASPKRT